MALGGGLFTSQNKILPGAYINFVNASTASSTLSDRGYAALGIEMDWGPDGQVFTVTAETFKNDVECQKIFGFQHGDSHLDGLEDLFKNTKTGYFYKLNTGGEKSSCTYATALYTGVRGDEIEIVIANNEAYTTENPLYDIKTYFDGVLVDMQTVSAMAGLKNNDYVTFNKTATIAVTAGTLLTGGTNGTVLDATYQTFLDAIESYNFNALGCLSSSDTIKELFVNYTIRMRDEIGKKFQCVLHRYTAADHEGIISVENNDTSVLVPWVLGITAGCQVNKSNSNRIYDGRFTVDTNYTQSELEDGIEAGKFMFHKVDDSVRVLLDINTFTSFTDEKTDMFADNQTIRIIDQIANDIAAIFNDKYLGNIANDAAGRISLWNDIVKYHQDMQTIGAIEKFYPDDIKVQQGQTKNSVVVSDAITIINAMAKLYMNIVIN